MDATAYVINKMRNITIDAAKTAIECNLSEKAVSSVEDKVRHQLNGIIILFDSSEDKDIAPVFVLEDLNMWAESFMNIYFSKAFKKCGCGNWHYASYCDMC